MPPGFLLACIPTPLPSSSAILLLSTLKVPNSGVLVSPAPPLWAFFSLFAGESVLNDWLHLRDKKIWQPQLALIPPGNNELEPIGAAPFQWATLSPSSTHSSRLATCLPHVGIFVCDSWLNDYELCDFIHFLVAAYVGVALGGHTVIQLSTRLGQIASFSRRDQAVLLTDPKDWWSWQCVEAASVRLCWTSCRTRCQIICKFVFCMGAERFGT